jgi:hypothetical protein
MSLPFSSDDCKGQIKDTTEEQQGDLYDHADEGLFMTFTAENLAASTSGGHTE